MRSFVSLIVIFSVLFSVNLGANDTQIRGPKNLDLGEQGRSYGPIKESDTLWRIATKVRPSNSVSVYQVMQALFEKNPSSFLDNNINHLRVGSYLKIPTVNEIRSIDPNTAQEKSELHDTLWEKRQKGQASSDEINLVVQKAQQANKQDVENAKSEIQDELKALKQQQGEQLVELKEEFKSSVDNVETILKENETLNKKVEALHQQLETARTQMDADSQMLQELRDMIAAQKAMMEEQRRIEQEKAKQFDFTELTNNPLLLLLLLLVPGFAIVVGAFIFLKRRQKAKVQPEESLFDKPAASAAVAAGAAAVAAPAFSEDSFDASLDGSLDDALDDLLDEDISPTNDSFDLGEDDLLADDLLSDELLDDDTAFDDSLPEPDDILYDEEEPSLEDLNDSLDDGLLGQDELNDLLSQDMSFDEDFDDAVIEDELADEDFTAGGSSSIDDILSQDFSTSSEPDTELGDGEIELDIPLQSEPDGSVDNEQDVDDLIDELTTNDVVITEPDDELHSVDLDDDLNMDDIDALIDEVESNDDLDDLDSLLNDNNTAPETAATDTQDLLDEFDIADDISQSLAEELTDNASSALETLEDDMMSVEDIDSLLDTDNTDDISVLADENEQNEVEQALETSLDETLVDDIDGLDELDTLETEEAIDINESLSEVDELSAPENNIAALTDDIDELEPSEVQQEVETSLDETLDDIDALDELDTLEAEEAIDINENFSEVDELSTPEDANDIAALTDDIDELEPSEVQQEVETSLDETLHDIDALDELDTLEAEEAIDINENISEVDELSTPEDENDIAALTDDIGELKPSEVQQEVETSLDETLVDNIDALDTLEAKEAIDINENISEVDELSTPEDENDIAALTDDIDELESSEVEPELETELGETLVDDIDALDTLEAKEAIDINKSFSEVDELLTPEDNNDTLSLADELGANDADSDLELETSSDEALMDEVNALNDVDSGASDEVTLEPTPEIQDDELAELDNAFDSLDNDDFDFGDDPLSQEIDLGEEETVSAEDLEEQFDVESPSEKLDSYHELEFDEAISELEEPLAAADALNLAQSIAQPDATLAELDDLGTELGAEPDDMLASDIVTEEELQYESANERSISGDFEADEFAETDFDSLLNELTDEDDGLGIDDEQEIDFGSLLEEDSLGEEIELSAEDDFVDIDQLLADSDNLDGDDEPYRDANMDVGLGDFEELLAPEGSPDVDLEAGGFSAKLDLARAYLEIDDDENALKIVQEVIEQGPPEVQDEAQMLLGELKPS